MSKLVDWDCPACNETNTDFKDWHTHCAYCGEVVYVMGEDDVFDLGYKVPEESFVPYPKNN